MSDKTDHTPPSVSADGRKNWLDAFEGPRITSRQNLIVAGMASAGCLVLGAAILAMLPLKERVPYFVEVETVSGKVAAAPDRTATAFKPEERHVRYFMNQWVQNFLTIDPRTREYLLPASYAFVKGEGVRRWAHFIEAEDKTLRRIMDTPTLRRDVKVVSISFVSEGVALLRLQINESGWTAPKNKAMTIFYSVVPPEADDKIISNPIGFYITNFTINDELV